MAPEANRNARFPHSLPMGPPWTGRVAPDPTGDSSDPEPRPSAERARCRYSSADCTRRVRRHSPGGTPTTFLKARLKAASDW